MGPSGTQGASGSTGLGYKGLTSNSTVQIGYGNKIFEHNLDINNTAFQIGDFVTITPTDDTPGYWLYGQIYYFASGISGIQIMALNGSGTFSSWIIGLSGTFGRTGATGAGLTGATGADSTVPGATGVQGASGSTGLTGATGIQGASGVGTSGTSVTIIDDVSTDATVYPLFANTTSGTASTIFTSNTNLNYNPSTGTLAATIFNSLSDNRFKTNIETIQNAFEKLQNLRGVEYVWKNTNTKSYGVIAQEVELYIPELVGTDSEGKKSVNYSALSGFFIEIIKNQEKRIEELEKIVLQNRDK